jgi:hypothetical protein
MRHMAAKIKIDFSYDVDGFFRFCSSRKSAGIDVSSTIDNGFNRRRCLLNLGLLVHHTLIVANNVHWS